MPRERVSYKIDKRIIDVISRLAEQEGISRNRFLEKHFGEVGIRLGILPADFKPLGETRGGDRRRKELPQSDTQKDLP